MNSAKNPFFVDTDSPSDGYNQRRYQHTLRFINKLDGDVLDCGERNPITDLIEKRFEARIANTVGDLDILPITGKYDYILAFEIIEHLMNPLWFLLQTNQALKPNGTVYLSTPINKPKFLWRHDHFHEFDEFRLESLIDRAGFEILRKERQRFYKITGVRPIIRVLLKTGTMFMELRSKLG